MNSLINYLKSHKYFRVKDIEKHYLTDSVKDNLVKNNLTLQELCYRIRNDIPLDKIFICRYCGKKIKFQFNKYNTFCNNKCANLYKNSKPEFIKSVKLKKSLQTKEDKELILERSKKTCLEKYGVPFSNQSKSVRDKYKQTCLNKYGVDHFSKSKEFKDRQLEIQEKIKQTSLEKYNVDNYSKSNKFKCDLVNRNKKIKQTCLEKYGVESYSQTKDYLMKQLITKKHNGTLNTSKAEKIILQLLREKFHNVKDHYRSDRYPFECDFYIPEKDLYIEYNGHWTHGPEPFDKNNPEHIKLVARSKSKNSNFHNKFIYVWTDLDVRKLETFKRNNLNYKIFWNLEEFRNWYDTLI